MFLFYGIIYSSLIVPVPVILHCPATSDWGGVSAGVVENDTSAYIALNGCAWSSKSSFWSFGPNKDTLTDVEQCLPDGHDGALKGTGDDDSVVLPESTSRCTAGGVLSPILRHTSNATIGQEVRYVYECPQGFAFANYQASRS